LRETMTDHVGVIRDRIGLETAIWTLADIETSTVSPRLRAMARAALFVTVAAHQRLESRGGHFRSDFPQTKDALAHRSRLTLDQMRSHVSSIIGA